MSQNYGRGRVKRQLAFLDTLFFAMDNAKEIDIEGVRFGLHF